MAKQAKQLQWHAPGNGNIVGNDGEFIVHVPRPKGANATARRDEIVALIAAAPEQHEALKQCWDVIADFLGQCTDQEIEDSFGLFEDALESARIAIAKAQGGTQ